MNKTDFFQDARRDIPGPLAGIRVLEATTTWAGPMCGCLLADFGADVIKVELPEGEVSRTIPPFLPKTNPPISNMHATVNRNKRSLSLDLRTPEGREIFLKLASRSEVVLENFRPGTMDKWGIGYDAVRKVKPDIIYTSISGFGQYGPDHDRAGYDTLAQATSGFMALNGNREGTPMRAATALGDDLAGMHGALATLAALSHHHRTGEGQHIDVSLLDSMLFQSNGMLTLGALGVPLQRWGNESPYAMPANLYACRDGHIRLAVVLDSHWKILARLIGRPDLADDPEFAQQANRFKHRDEVNALISAWCAPRSAEEVLAVLIRAGLAAAPIRTYEQAARDPHVGARDMLQDTRQADGSTIPLTGPAAKFSRTPTRVRTAAPALGAHDEDILRALDFSTADIERLREKGVLTRRRVVSG
jgi:crotonobetainyl-CoA:carnitine CoA-transferase CaiB-like acyl-CoA transferase